MDGNTSVSSFISLDYFRPSTECSKSTTSKTCTNGQQKCTNDKKLSKHFEDLKINEQMKLDKRQNAIGPIESATTSPSQISPSLFNDDPISLLSTGSTDLSRFLVSCSSILLPTSSGREGDDETSTAAESTSTVTNSHEDKTSNVVSSLSNFNNKPSSSVAESGNRRKLIRSNSFTVETPTFKNLPSCDSTNHSALVASNLASPIKGFDVNSFSTIGANDNRSPKWCLVKKRNNSSPNASAADSPVVSNTVAERTIELLNCDELDDFDATKIEEQVLRLKNMQIMLAEYHKLQLDHLKIRQQSEIETLQTQVECMEKILAKLKSKTTASRSKSSSSTYTSKKLNSAYATAKIPSVNCSIIQKTPSTCQLIPSAAHFRPTGQLLFKNDSIPDVLKQRLAALIKGYLLRRFLKVARIKKLIETVKDVRHQLINLSREKHLNDSDCQFGEILLLQLKNILEEFHTFVFVISSVERMKLIGVDREIQSRDHSFKFSVSLDSSSPQKKLSSATIKRLTSKSSSSSSLMKSRIKNRRYFGSSKFLLKSPRKSPSSSSSVSTSHHVRYSPNIFSLNKSQLFTCSNDIRKPWR